MFEIVISKVKAVSWKLQKTIPWNGRLRPFSGHPPARNNISDFSLEMACFPYARREWNWLTFSFMKNTITVIDCPRRRREARSWG
jgi:hypothetical protein